MTNSPPLVFCDSGIGGLPYLDWVRKRLPGENFLYLADTAGFPYGEKDPVGLRSLLKGHLELLNRRFTPKAVILACNTASVVTLGYLRNHFFLPLVGTVPAIKPAAGLPGRRCIGLLATNRTVEEAYTRRLIQDFASHCRVVKRGIPGLVDFVERKLHHSSQEEVEEYLRPLVEDLSDRGVDTLVLGCTHFVFLKAALQRMFKFSVEIVDSVEGVGRQVLRIVEKTGRAPEGAVGRARFYTTGGTGGLEIPREFAHRFDMEDLGVLT